MHRPTFPLTVAAASLALTGCSAGQDPAPTATVTVTATPSAEPTTATPAPTTEVPAETAQAAPAPETEAPVAEPTAAEQAPGPAETEDAPQGVSIIASEGMEGDDYIIRLITPAGVLATQNHAAGVLASKVQELTGTPQAANIDLVAVYSSDGVMVGSDRIPGGKWG